MTAIVGLRNLWFLQILHMSNSRSVSNHQNDTRSLSQVMEYIRYKSQIQARNSLSTYKNEYVIVRTSMSTKDLVHMQSQPADLIEKILLTTFCSVIP